jgi:hypothetical protein
MEVKPVAATPAEQCRLWGGFTDHERRLVIASFQASRGYYYVKMV